MSATRMVRAEGLIKSRHEEITDAWINHFGG